MANYSIVVEPDNVARYWINHDSADATFAAAGVSVLSQGYIEAYQTSHSLADYHAVLADMGISDALPANQ